MASQDKSCVVCGATIHQSEVAGEGPPGSCSYVPCGCLVHGSCLFRTDLWKCLGALGTPHAPTLVTAVTFHEPPVRSPPARPPARHRYHRCHDHHHPRLLTASAPPSRPSLAQELDRRGVAKKTDTTVVIREDEHENEDEDEDDDEGEGEGEGPSPAPKWRQLFRTTKSATAGPPPNHHSTGPTPGLPVEDANADLLRDVVRAPLLREHVERQVEAEGDATIAIGLVHGHRHEPYILEARVGPASDTSPAETADFMAELGKAIHMYVLKPEKPTTSTAAAVHSVDGLFEAAMADDGAMHRFFHAVCTGDSRRVEEWPAHDDSLEGKAPAFRRREVVGAYAALEVARKVANIHHRHPLPHFLREFVRAQGSGGLGAVGDLLTALSLATQKVATELILKTGGVFELDEEARKLPIFQGPLHMVPTLKEVVSRPTPPRCLPTPSPSLPLAPSLSRRSTHARAHAPPSRPARPPEPGQHRLHHSGHTGRLRAVHRAGVH